MSSSTAWRIITFPSTHAALKAERALADAEVPAVTIPVPRWITADCGIAIRFRPELKEAVETTLAVQGVEFKEIHERGSDR
ncbi:MAG: DUF3343 domain-containing protein [Candidatus Aquicultorales bacterium]